MFVGLALASLALHCTRPLAQENLACNWRPVAFNLFQGGRQFAYKMSKICEDLPAIGGHPGSISTRLAANRKSVRLAENFMLNLHATGDHPAAICNRVATRPFFLFFCCLAASRKQIELRSEHYTDENMTLWSYPGPLLLVKHYVKSPY